MESGGLCDGMLRHLYSTGTGYSGACPGDAGHQRADACDGDAGAWRFWGRRYQADGGRRSLSRMEGNDIGCGAGSDGRRTVWNISDDIQKSGTAGCISFWAVSVRGNIGIICNIMHSRLISYIMNQFYVICRDIVKLFTAIMWGLLFGIFFLSGLAFLAGRQIYYETSDSMSPVIEKGSLLFVKEKEEYDTGDIVAFYAPYGGQVICVTHRIVDKVQQGAYVTKGDANEREDQLIIREAQIFGEVTEYIPYFGYICFFIQRNSTFLLFFFVFSLLWKG